MTALVTGGAGFIGSWLVRRLIETGTPVRVFDLPHARRDHLPPQIEFVPGDIRDASAVSAAVRGCRAVYHLAADPRLWARRRGHFDRVNHRGSVHVLSLAAEAGAGRIVHCSTESILTRSGQSGPIGADQEVPPREVIGPYCRSKWRAERFAFRLARRGAPVVIVNPTLPIGPGDYGRSPPTRMLLDCARGLRSAYLDADLNLIDVRDAAEGLRLAGEVGRPGRRYLLGAEDWTIHRLFAWVAARTGAAPPRWAVPYPLALTAAYVDEWIADVCTGREPAATVTGVKLTRRVMRFDASRSLAELGLKPRPVQSSLADALDWYRDVGWLPRAARSNHAVPNWRSPASPRPGTM